MGPAHGGGVGDFPHSHFTDCKTVQLGVQKGAQWAGSAKRRYARIWTVIHAGLDDGAQAELLRWMLAHTDRRRIGDACGSDGQILSEEMWCANQMVDLLAKDAAHSVRQSAATIDWLKHRHSQLRQAAVFVGQLTAEAGAHLCEDGKVRRDSVELSPQQKQQTGKPGKAATATRSKEAAHQDSAPGVQKGEGSEGEWQGTGGRQFVSRRGRTKTREACRRTRLSNAQWVAEQRDADAFEHWWRDSREARLSHNSAVHAGPVYSAAERFEALKLGVAAKHALV